MSEKNTMRTSLEEAVLQRSEDKTDWASLRREQEAGIEPEPEPDEGEFDWSTARVVMPPRKSAISIRLDDDVLDFFRSQGDGYQTKINRALRIFMNAVNEVARS